jgi:vacuolar-type H+-ATPase subunit E/Vma4
MEDQLKATHLEVLCTADLNSDSLSTRHQVEIVDLVLKLKDRIMDLNGKPEKRSKLQEQLKNLLTSVDDELKSVLLSNCSLREAFEI